MKKSGISGNPIRFRVQSQERMEELVAICEKNSWKFICGMESHEPEDISELEYMLNPKAFNGQVPRMKSFVEPIKKGVQIGRNDPCPCGSELKYKKCCIGK